MSTARRVPPRGARRREATPRSAGAFDLQGHRGARGLAPENTLAGFRKALEIGVSTLELDLAMTRDGVLVVSHDPVLNPDVVRGPDGRWLAQPGPAINTLTLAELRRYDVDASIPGAATPSSGPSRRPLTARASPRSRRSSRSRGRPAGACD